MTTYAPNFTPRYKLHYKVGNIEHTVQIRTPRGTDLGGTEFAGHALRDIWNGLAAYLLDDLVFLTAEVALTDSDVFGPASLPVAVTGTLDPADYNARERIRGLTWNGRSTGSKARFTLFGLMFPDEGTGVVGSDGLILGSEVAAITSGAATATTYFKAGSGNAAVFQGRATYKENDHLLSLVRKGTIS